MPAKTAIKYISIKLNVGSHRPPPLNLTVCSLNVVAVTLGRLHLQQLHGPVQQAMDHLKARALVVVNSAETSAVPRADIWLVGQGKECYG